MCRSRISPFKRLHSLHQVERTSSICNNVHENCYSCFVTLPLFKYGFWNNCYVSSRLYKETRCVERYISYFFLFPWTTDDFEPQKEAMYWIGRIEVRHVTARCSKCDEEAERELRLILTRVIGCCLKFLRLLGRIIKKLGPGREI